jgi:predicted SAM-dependent methyltransferase
VPAPLLEYRQHDKHQENDRFNYFAQLHFYRTSYHQVMQEKKHLEEVVRKSIVHQHTAFYYLNTYLKKGVPMIRKIAGKIKRKSVSLAEKVNRRLTTTSRRLSLIGRDYSKLHLGCGAKIIPGWLNVDIDSSFGSHVYALDLREPFPFPDNSVSRIFIEHTIENLTKEECRQFFSESYRVLQPKGAMRIAISDISKLMKAYQTKNKKYRVLMQTDMQPLVTNTWDEFLMDMLFNWHRRSYFTFPLLKAFMKRAGFEKIKRKAYGKSDYSFAFDSRQLPDTVYAEAQKI